MCVCVYKSQEEAPPMVVNITVNSLDVINNLS